MVDFHPSLVSALKTVVPTYYEMALTSNASVPCISFMESNNYDSDKGSNREYSVITYQIKIWANDIATIQHYAREVDTVLRPLGFKRIASGELHDNESSMIQKIMSYECLSLENY